MYSYIQQIYLHYGFVWEWTTQSDVRVAYIFLDHFGSWDRLKK